MTPADLARRARDRSEVITAASNDPTHNPDRCAPDSCAHCQEPLESFPPGAPTADLYLGGNDKRDIQPARPNDRIGHSDPQTRRADPRIIAAIRAALGNVESVVNVGAGAGCYEPTNTVLAIEPNRTMIAQRPTGAAPVVQATAESLPLRDGCVDAALASMTVHHWTNLTAGLTELGRIARRRIVFFTWHPDQISGFWLLADYLPDAAAADAQIAVPLEQLTAHYPHARTTIRPVPIAHGCTGGVLAAYWRRPHAYLDPNVYAGIVTHAKINPVLLAAGLADLAQDLRTGRWQEQYHHLTTLDTLDAGYVTITIDLA